MALSACVGGRPRRRRRRSPCARRPRTRGAARNEDRPVLVADGLGVEGVDEAARRCHAPTARAASRGGRRSRPTRRAGRRARAALADGIGMPGGARRRSSSIRSAAMRTARPFEHGAGLEDLDRFLVRDRPHARAAMRLADDEALLLQTDQRRSHGAARHRELRAHVGLDQARVRRDRRPARSPRAARHSSSSWPSAAAYCRIVAKIVNNPVLLRA